jgi:hypothetical protein
MIPTDNAIRSDLSLQPKNIVSRHAYIIPHTAVKIVSHHVD